MAPPPLEDLFDWRVPYVLTLAMIWVSALSEFDELVPGLRTPPRMGLPSPVA